MNRIVLLIGGALLLFAHNAASQALSYDLHYVLPEERRVGGVALGFYTPRIDRRDQLNNFEMVAKYALANQLEVGARAAFDLYNMKFDNFSALTLGGKYGLTERSAVALNVTPVNAADKVGLSTGLMSSAAFSNWGINSHLLLGFLEGYRPQGALLDGLIQPVLPLGQRVFIYLDILLTSDTEKPEDHLEVLLGPNVDVELVNGWILNAGIRFSLYSGESIPRNTDIGVGVALFKSALVW